MQYFPLLAIAICMLTLTGFSSDSNLAAVAQGIIIWVFGMAVMESKVLRHLGKHRVAGSGVQ